MDAEAAQDVAGATAAHAAAFSGDADALIAIGKEDATLLRAKTEDGETPAYVLQRLSSRLRVQHS